MFSLYRELVDSQCWKLLALFGFLLVLDRRNSVEIGPRMWGVARRLTHICFQHSHLFVQFFGWYENEHEIFLAMEYVEHGDLGGYMKDHQTARANAQEITRQILEGLQVLHEEGICHRDLKPQVCPPPQPTCKAFINCARTSSSLPAIQSG